MSFFDFYVQFVFESKTNKVMSYKNINHICICNRCLISVCILFELLPVCQVPTTDLQFVIAQDVFLKSFSIIKKFYETCRSNPF